MPKHYRLALSDDERHDLKTLVARRSASAEPVKRALMLLAADETDGAPALSDAEIAERYHVSTRTVERLRQRTVKHGVEVALNGFKRGPRNPLRKFDGEVEARLVALRCSEPPEDRVGWTLHLLADRLVALDVVDSISHETVRQILSQTRSSRGASVSG
jgi:transposase